MKKILLICILAILSFVLHAKTSRYETIIKLNTIKTVRHNSFGLEELDHRLARFKIQKIEQIHPQFPYYVIYSQEKVDAKRMTLERINGVQYIEENKTQKLLTTLNDPFYDEQFLSTFYFEEAWELESGKNSVLVGIVDSGLSLNHPDLKSNIFVNQAEIPQSIFSNIDSNQDFHITNEELYGYFSTQNLDLDDDGIITKKDWIHEDSPLMDSFDNDQNGYPDDLIGWDFTDAPEYESTGIGDFLIRDNDVSDETWHGTHIAGIIGADTNNDEGIAGVCWNTSILPIRAGFKAAGPSGGILQNDDIVSAMIYAVESSVDVLNMSWGDTQYSQILDDICAYAQSQGVILVAAAGNSGEQGINSVLYPAKYTSTICVGNVTSEGYRALNSSYGPELDIMAPGSSILSTVDPNDDIYGIKSGTSMAAPHVVGVIALMLSRNPSLTEQDIRSQLFSTAEIPFHGNELEYGHGIIRPDLVLNASTTDIVEIQNPLNGQGYPDDFPIMGTASSPTLKYYTAMYKEIDSTIWKDVQTHQTTPTKYRVSVENGLLASFNIQENFPDGYYQVRVQLTNQDNKTMQEVVEISIDTTNPELISSTPVFERRFWNEKATYSIASEWSENVQLTYQILLNGNQTKTYRSLDFSNKHTLILPDECMDYAISTKITAKNRSGLETETEWYENVGQTTSFFIPSYGFSVQNTFSPIVSSKEANDYNENGNNELYLMNFDNTPTGVTSVYEKQNNHLVKQHLFFENIWPRAIGSMNNTTWQVLGSFDNTLHLFESFTTQNYPEISIWNADDNDLDAISGVFKSYNETPEDELFIMYRENALRKIAYFTRTDKTLFREGEIYNTSETDFVNQFTLNFSVSDLDGDTHKEVVTGDKDGDLMIYEMVQNPLGFVDSLRYLQRLAIPEINLIDTGDLDGDGTDEVVVCGYSINNDDETKTIARLFVLDAISNNTYTIVDSIAFRNVVSTTNSLKIANIDETPEKEIVLALSPNLYTMKLEDEKIIPTWIGESMQTYQVGIFETTANESAGIIVNQQNAGTLEGVLYAPDAPYNGPSIPNNFTVFPRNETSAEFTWKSVPNVNHYELILLPENNEQQVITTNDNHILLEDLLPQTNYEAFVRSYNETMDPQLSIPSFSQSFFTSPEPLINAVKLFGNNRILIEFNRSLHHTANNIENFYLVNEAKHPTTASLVHNNEHIELFFDFALTEDSYALQLLNIKSDTGTYFSSQTVQINGTLDTDPPTIVHTEIISSDQVKIQFSEVMNHDLASTIFNYDVSVPDTDLSNKIIQAESYNDIVTLTFEKRLEYSNTGYWLTIRNLKDLAGNLLPNTENKTRFNLTEIRDLQYVEAVPNPLYTKEFNKIQWINIPLNVSGKIRLYDVTGLLVFEDKIEARTTQNNAYAWSLKNKKNKDVASGLYYYILKVGSHTKKGKISIIR